MMVRSDAGVTARQAASKSNAAGAAAGRSASASVPSAGPSTVMIFSTAVPAAAARNRSRNGRSVTATRAAESASKYRI